jgi:hypothetical protein
MLPKKRWLRYACLGAAILSSDLAAAQGWIERQNERFGLAFGAVKNTEAHTPASYQAFTERETYRNDRITYRKRGRNWFVLSGFKGEKIFYEKVIFSCGGRLINGFALSYPARHNRAISPVIERIEDTFRPGPRNCP